MKRVSEPQFCSNGMTEASERLTVLENSFDNITTKDFYRVVDAIEGILDILLPTKTPFALEFELRSPEQKVRDDDRLEGMDPEELKGVVTAIGKLLK